MLKLPDNYEPLAFFLTEINLSRLKQWKVLWIRTKNTAESIESLTCGCLNLFILRNILSSKRVS